MVCIVYGLVHADELGSQIKEQGRLQLSAALVLGPTLDEVSDLDGHEVHDFGRRRAGEGREERLQVRLVTLSRDHDHLGDSVIVPACEELVDSTMEGLSAKGACARIRRPVRLCEAIMESWRDDNVQTGREREGHALRDERVGAERQVGSVVIEGAHRENEPRIALEEYTNFGPRQVIQLI